MLHAGTERVLAMQHEDALGVRLHETAGLTIVLDRIFPSRQGQDTVKRPGATWTAGAIA
jgi:hypothetical protein